MSHAKCHFISIHSPAIKQFEAFQKIFKTNNVSIFIKNISKSEFQCNNNYIYRVDDKMFSKIDEVFKKIRSDCCIAFILQNTSNGISNEIMCDWFGQQKLIYFIGTFCFLLKINKMQNVMVQMSVLCKVKRSHKEKVNS